VDEIAEVCEQARRYARQHPITQATISVARYRPTIFQPYMFKVGGQYHVIITYRVAAVRECPIPPPFWHVQIAVLEPIEDLAFGATREALVATKDWTDSERTVASEILGEALGPVMKTPSQRAHLHIGLWDQHWMVEGLAEEEYATRGS
jgi:hypothetical protein